MLNSSKIQSQLQNLSTDTPAQFGIMTPQHMVEHMTITMKLSSGRIKLPEFEPNEKQLMQKQALIYTDIEFPKGVRAPNSNGELPDLRFPDLETAKEKLVQSVQEYEEAFENNPKFRSIHPRFGYLTFDEWEKFHHKHFKHHFGQFGIW
ncbi:MAG TPA: hypothetical protein DEQ87_02020 [Algoriphagus sp.]|jgi:oxepin-CoA hydrolase/3-oxo-5,6-dehydrosuberyl-CoA semialdehyde dehydrogenase|uniref:Oxepin-CoA hydrolase / 3-oxo-5,6-dehydrosuberyl-CoA semialdehyde dehydrogenase n=1 Tax=Algoriphagus ornithinivorans TaxID=226506 RepID=A0A1I5JGQ1_9BACT|nr:MULTISPECIES: hypothetical protein [Algoriphagus]MAL13140.1 hypothetical protein [Algoriphagus sp.]QYH41079.1 hypothetical protein GYM62_20595 [Algoriphagus sp. NBT04N3]SFO71870.1 Protein of unknown function [Algoriphagus ornithinivorans]HAD50021.1 hypothetical protein [Algoriphagus sp.]HAH37896.1 hypothetical protein [Algoriphagus sp.]